MRRAILAVGAVAVSVAAPVLPMNYPVLVGEGRDDLQKAFPWLGLPNTFIIDRDGQICHEHTGLATKDQIDPIIKALL